MKTFVEFILTVAIFNPIKVVIIFLLAWLIHRLSRRMAGLLLRLDSFILPTHFNRLTGMVGASKSWSQLNQWLPAELKTARQGRHERQETLQELLASGISLLAFVLATIISLAQFAEQETVVWVTTLLGMSLAFAGRTFIGDFLTGLNIIFQDRFNVGEKILVKAQFEKIEGIVEHVSLNTTWLRAPTGELYTIANGEMRFICNYSRGLFSAAHVKITIATADLNRALPLLQKLGPESVALLPALREPWRVINETGVMGQSVELTLAAKAHFGQAADLRPQLLTLVQERLALADIAIE
jgi:small conductance mechanosensitive channel